MSASMSSRITVLVLLGCATAASACSSCSAPAGEEGTATRWAYYGTAILLTLLPGLLLGSLIVWLRRQGGILQRRDAERAEDRRGRVRTLER